MTPLLDPQMTVGELVRQQPSRSRIFEQLKIDYCCGGKLPLADACAKRGLDVAQVLDQLVTPAIASAATSDLQTLGLSELADHIVRTHHAYLRSELPRLNFMTRKVAAVHGDREPRLLELRQVFRLFQEEIGNHLFVEEQAVFPLIRNLDHGFPMEDTESAPPLHIPFDQMEREHQSAGAALARFRELTDDFTPPDWACNTYRAMVDALHELEQDTHRHVHKENNLLFPQALEREKTAALSLHLRGESV